MLFRKIAIGGVTPLIDVRPELGPQVSTVVERAMSLSTPRATPRRARWPAWLFRAGQPRPRVAGVSDPRARRGDVVAQRDARGDHPDGVRGLVGDAGRCAHRPTGTGNTPWRHPCCWRAVSSRRWWWDLPADEADASIGRRGARVGRWRGRAPARRRSFRCPRPRPRGARRSRSAARRERAGGPGAKAKERASSSDRKSSRARSRANARGRPRGVHQSRVLTAYWHTPAPLHSCGGRQGTSAFVSVRPCCTNTQRPRLLAKSQRRQVSVQAPSQQTPSLQKPLVHSRASEQLDALAFLARHMLPPQ